jgi:hypothetical protein
MPYIITVERLKHLTFLPYGYILKNDYSDKRLHGNLILASSKGESKKLPTERGDAFVIRYMKVDTRISSKHRHVGSYVIKSPLY